MASRQINNTSRDIKRRIDLITKKVNELKALGVPVAVVYSTTKTNGLYVLGDSRITQVIDKYRDEILMNPDWVEEDVLYTTTVMLAPLPAKLSMLNGLTMKVLIRGLMKDLKLTWKSEKPLWWPATIPFQTSTVPPQIMKV
jgi:hypothetical protein